MTHLIACDLDGTLLSKQSKLSKKTIDVLKKLQDQGHHIVISTGRPYYGALHYYHELNLKGLMITDNGGLISHPNDSNFIQLRTTIPLNIMHDWFIKTKELLISAIYAIDDTSYAYKYNETLEFLFNGIVNPKLIEKDFDQLDVEPTSIVLVINQNDQNRFESLMQKHFSKFISFRFWGDHKGIIFYEVYMNYTSKASGLKMALDYYRLPKEALIAIGDGVNDFEMIEYAQTGIAMKNASLELQEVANYVTDLDHENDGAALFLEKLLLT